MVAAWPVLLLLLTLVRCSGARDQNKLYEKVIYYGYPFSMNIPIPELESASDHKLDIEYIPFVTLTETRGNSVYIEGIPFDDRDTFLNLDVETPQSDTFTIRIHFIIEKRDFTSEGCELSPVLQLSGTTIGGDREVLIEDLRKVSKISDYPFRLIKKSTYSMTDWRVQFMAPVNCSLNFQDINIDSTIKRIFREFNNGNLKAVLSEALGIWDLKLTYVKKTIRKQLDNVYVGVADILPTIKTTSPTTTSYPSTAATSPTTTTTTKSPTTTITISSTITTTTTTLPTTTTTTSPTTTTTTTLPTTTTTASPTTTTTTTPPITTTTTSPTTTTTTSPTTTTTTISPIITTTTPITTTTTTSPLTTTTTTSPSTTTTTASSKNDEVIVSSNGEGMRAINDSIALEGSQETFKAKFGANLGLPLFIIIAFIAIASAVAVFTVGKLKNTHRKTFVIGNAYPEEVNDVVVLNTTNP